MALIALCWATASAASSIVHESREAVLVRTQRAIVAEVRGVQSGPDDEFSRVVTLRIQPIRSVFGAAVTRQKMRCEYREGRPHRRGNTAVSPLVSGSGNEFDLKRGERVLLLLAETAKDNPQCAILRVEPIANEQAIRTGLAALHDAH